MDTATQLAFRALVRGLLQEGTINEGQVRRIMGELQDAADGQRELGHPVEARELTELANEIGRDASLGD